MNPESLILLMITGWLCVAASMLWGMLRVSRRHAGHSLDTPAPTAAQAAPRVTGPRPAPAHRQALRLALRPLGSH